MRLCPVPLPVSAQAHDLQGLEKYAASVCCISVCGRVQQQCRTANALQRPMTHVQTHLTFALQHAVHECLSSEAAPCCHAGELCMQLGLHLQ